MKSKFFICLFILGLNVLNAQVKKSVNCTAGSLATALSPSELSSVNELTITGQIDERDFATMNASMPSLNKIDIKDVTIQMYIDSDYPDNEIPTNAFTSVSRLKSITFPNSLQTIGYFAFQQSGLSGSVVIPEGVKGVYAGAFRQCSLLTSVTIPSTIESLGTSAFAWTGLTKVTVNRTTPVLLDDHSLLFEGVNFTKCTLYVPKGSKSLYQAAYGWNVFTNIVEQDGSSAISQPELSKCDISVIDNKVVIKNIPTNGKITITSVDGIIIYEGKIISDEVAITLPQHGVYILTINDSSTKFIY